MLVGDDVFLCFLSKKTPRSIFLIKTVKNIKNETKKFNGYLD